MSSLLTTADAETKKDGEDEQDEEEEEEEEDADECLVTISYELSSTSSANFVYSDSSKVRGTGEEQSATTTSESSSKSSRVLHLRGIPSAATESDVISLAVTFGAVRNLVLARRRNQALLEMESLTSAEKMAKHYSQRPPTMKGHLVHVQYSKHQQLTVDADQTNKLKTVLEVDASKFREDVPSSVLRVVVQNMIYPVSLDLVHQIFSRFGHVLKIVTFRKNGGWTASPLRLIFLQMVHNTFQALVQFLEPQSAKVAKMGLTGQSVYQGCCTLRVDYSRLRSLSVRYNNEKSRDYTNPLLPPGDSIPLHIKCTSPSHFSPYLQRLQLIPSYSAATLQLAPPSAATAFSYGTISTVQGCGSAPVSNLITSSSSSSSSSPCCVTSGAAFHPGSCLLRLPATRGTTSGGDGHSCFALTTSVLIVSNLNEEMVTPDALFTLFGVYGDVIRVKIMFKKKHSALVQLVDCVQAQIAMTYLRKVRIWGRSIDVRPSLHASIQLPLDGQMDPGLTKDYTNSPLHRFKRPNSKNYQNIFPPSPVLHLSNIPTSTPHDQLIGVFKHHGTVTGFKFFTTARKMALLQMGSTEEAVHALIALHNYQLAETAHLRVSFSKSVLSPEVSLEQNAT